MENNNTSNIKVAFAALDPYLTTNIVENVEKKISGKDFISWGEDNAYPNYLYSLYKKVPTLGSIINACSDYTKGNGVICNIQSLSFTINEKGETIDDLIDKISLDYWIFGSFAIQVIKDFLGNITELYHIPILRLRSNEDNSVFFYSDDWSKSYGRVKYIVYPKYQFGDENATSIFYFKDNTAITTYGNPIWESSVIAAEIEKSINEFHLNEINNNFLTSKIINLNNGVPDDNLKEEIEKNINEKFSGKDNAGRLMIIFNENADNAATVSDLSQDDFDERYTALSERSKSQLFVAFRCTPNLIGYPDQTTGFNSQEYADAFKLFNRTVIQPVQKNIIKSFDKIFNTKDSISIRPFSLEQSDKTEITRTE
jgi:hypothetical protein